MILRIDHIGLVARSLDEASDLLLDKLTPSQWGIVCGLLTLGIVSLFLYMMRTLKEKDRLLESHLQLISELASSHVVALKDLERTMNELSGRLERALWRDSKS